MSKIQGVKRELYAARNEITRLTAELESTAKSRDEHGAYGEELNDKLIRQTTETERLKLALGSSEANLVIAHKVIANLVIELRSIANLHEQPSLAAAVREAVLEIGLDLPTAPEVDAQVPTLAEVEKSVEVVG